MSPFNSRQADACQKTYVRTSGNGLKLYEARNVSGWTAINTNKYEDSNNARFIYPASFSKNSTTNKQKRPLSAHSQKRAVGDARSQRNSKSRQQFTATKSKRPFSAHPSKREDRSWNSNDLANDPKANSKNKQTRPSTAKILGQYDQERSSTNHQSLIKQYQLKQEKKRQQNERNQMDIQNQKLVEKNETLRRELDRLQQNRYIREKQRKVATKSKAYYWGYQSKTGKAEILYSDKVTSNTLNNSRSSSRAASRVSSSDISTETLNSTNDCEAITIDKRVNKTKAWVSSEQEKEDSNSKIETEKTKKDVISTNAAGSGVQAVRLGSQKHTTETKQTGKIGSRSGSVDRSNSKIRPEVSRGSSKATPSTVSDVSTDPQRKYKTKVQTHQSKPYVRPNSAHPRARDRADSIFNRKQTVKTYSNKWASSGSRIRPQSARPTTKAQRLNGANTEKYKNMSKQGQYAEKERLQYLVSSPDWDLKGKADMYVFGKLLGQGSFGMVRLAHHKITGHKVAIKTYEKSRMSEPGQLKRCRQEIKLMEKLNNVNIALLFETFETPKRVHFVMEALSGGNLCSYVKSKKRLPETEAVRIFCQIVEALDYLHRCNIVHRDVKLENVLFDSSKRIKLVDFGFSVVAGENKLKVFCGTPSYMAPEIVRRQEYRGFPVDVWSLGVLLYAMLCGRFPFTAKTYKELYKTILRGSFHIPESISPSTRDLLRRMICLKVDERITIRQIQCIGVVKRNLLSLGNRKQNDLLHLVSDDPRNDVKPELVKQLVDFGFPQEKLVKSILNREKNHLTATYYLLCMKAGKKKAQQQKQQRESGKEKRTNRISSTSEVEETK